MKYKKLGNSEVKVTPLTFGAWAIGGWMWGGADEKKAIEAIKEAYHLGITTIDTAPIYGFGKSEELVGKATKDLSRDKYQILTKFGMNWQSEDGKFSSETTDEDGNAIKIYKWASKERIKRECEDSLRRLQTDYIDLYQIHWPDSTTEISETMEALQELIDEGKIRAAGVCNYSAAQVEEALNTVNLATNQVPYSLINRENELDVIPQAKEKGMHILPYSPLQRGLLTGKMHPGYSFNEGDGRKTNKFFTDENIKKANDLLEEIKPIAEKYDATFAQLVINWTTRQPAMGSVLVGARNKKQVRDNAGALNFELTKEEVNAITKASEKRFPVK